MAETAQMNHALDELVKSIYDRGVSPTDRWDFVYSKKTFRCIPAGHGRPTGIIFGTFTDTQLRRGMSGGEWMKIRNAIARFVGPGSVE